MLPYQQKIFEKAARYCAYQERCQEEVRQRLYQYGVYGDEAEEMIVFLIQENFINEERFARSFAGGKFRLKKWGRMKIRQALKRKKISEYCIRKGMEEIEENDYIEVLFRLLETKFTQIQSKDPYIKRQKLHRYALQKGYESEIVWQMVQESF